MSGTISHNDRVREQFGGSAEAYVASPGHAGGDDLAALTARAAALDSPRRVALDIATGGGHTALALAPHVGVIIASDLTPRMLAKAAEFIAGRGVANVRYSCADAEHLPFADCSFDLVSCRIAAHHFGAIPAFVGEVARVLRAGGTFLLIDNVTPEQPDLDAFLHRAEVLRDPTHHRSFTAPQWRELFGANGLEISGEQFFPKTHPYASWLERARVAPGRRALLEQHFRSASDAARDTFGIAIDGDGQIVSFDTRAILLQGRKMR